MPEDTNGFSSFRTIRPLGRIVRFVAVNITFLTLVKPGKYFLRFHCQAITSLEDIYFLAPGLTARVERVSKIIQKNLPSATLLR